jgi:hypothetical protein
MSNYNTHIEKIKKIQKKLKSSPGYVSCKHETIERDNKILKYYDDTTEGHMYITLTLRGGEVVLHGRKLGASMSGPEPFDSFRMSAFLQEVDEMIPEPVQDMTLNEIESIVGTKIRIVG